MKWAVKLLVLEQIQSLYICVDKLHGVEHSIIPDRIEAGTLLIAGAITHVEISLFEVPSKSIWQVSI